MKNLLVFASVLLVSATIVVSCSKDEQLTPENLDVKSEKRFTIENETMVFNSLDDFKNTLNLLNNSTIEEIEEWEKSINFTSMFKYYDLASDDLCCGENANDFEAVKAKYQGKVHFTKDDVEPLLILGTIGRLVNTDGIFRIGHSIVKYTREKSISIPDGDLNKLEIALNTLEHNPDEGIYIHDLLNSEKTNCASYQEKKDYDASNNYYLRSRLWLLNSSFVTSDPYVGTFYNVVYELKTNIKHKKKRRFIGWKCERRNITWSNGFKIIHDLGNFNTPSWAINSPSPVTGGTGWTSGNECDFNYIYTVLFESVDPTAYYGHSINIDRLGQSSSVSNPSIVANTYCN